MRHHYGRPHASMRRSLSTDKKLLFASIATSMSLLLVLAVVIGIREPEKPKERVFKSTLDVATITILTPEKTMLPGDSFMEVPLKPIFWPRSQVPTGAAQDRADLKGKFARYVISPGEPITPKKTMDSKDRSGIPLPPGFRAVAISVNSESAVAYHAIPGTMVDVILSRFKGREPDTTVLVKGARVVSLGGETRTGPRAGTPRMKTITLSVKQPDALRIEHAKKLGSLSLQLRSHRSDEGEFKPKITRKDFDESKDEQKKSVCVNGEITMGGKGYILLCDGSIIPAPAREVEP